MTKAALNLTFLSHGTLESRDIDRSHAFYTEFFGLEVIRTSPISLMIRLGGQHTYAVVLNKKSTEKMPFLFHNGLDVSSDAEVDRAHGTCIEQSDKWGLEQISKPKIQHGTYSFYFWDADGNCWEILSNPDGGYSWLFERDDLDGRGHLSKDYKRPQADS